MRNHRWFAVSILAAGAVAQPVTLPSAVATKKPRTDLVAFPLNSQTFYSTSAPTILHDAHTQLIYDVDDIAPQVATWGSVSFRRPVGFGDANPPFTAAVTIKMCVGPNAHAAASTQFAANLNAAPVQVFKGPVSFSAALNPGSWPAIWQPVMFSLPFVYVKTTGKTLVLDILEVGNTANASWNLEATFPDTGNRTDNPPGEQLNCKFSNGKHNDTLAFATPFVGGSWNLSYGSLPASIVGLGALGGAGAGGTWGPLALPVDLAPYGAPGCQWGVRPDLVLQLTADATGTAAWPTLAVPNAAVLIDQLFYDHSLWIDPPANAWGVVTGWSSKWRIGSNVGAPGAVLYVTGDPATTVTTGTLQSKTATSILLN